MTQTAEQTQQAQKPRNIFEQIALGLQVTNENTVAIAQDLAVMFRMVQDIHGVMFPIDTSEPNASGAVEETK